MAGSTFAADKAARGSRWSECSAPPLRRCTTECRCRPGSRGASLWPGAPAANRESRICTVGSGSCAGRNKNICCCETLFQSVVAGSTVLARCVSDTQCLRILLLLLEKKGFENIKSLYNIGKRTTFQRNIIKRTTFQGNIMKSKRHFMKIIQIPCARGDGS